MRCAHAPYTATSHAHIVKEYGYSTGRGWRARLGSAQFGVTTFCASQHGAEECDSRGLPLTLNSVNITGRFKKLLSLSHPGLATYLDIKSSRNGKILRHRRSIMVPSREF